jgi:hypothetical protein
MGRADSSLRDRVVFLVGARRSGTNWLGRILAAHPEVVALPSETYLFSDGVRPLAERIQHANPGSQAMGETYVDRERFRDALRGLMDEVLLDNVERLGRDARYIVERTPWHAKHLPLIADVYPDARVIHIVRDGRAVARSLVSMEWGPDTIEEAATEWRDTVAGGRVGGDLFDGRYREVRYEELLADPRSRVAELTDWLGLALTGDVWDRILLEAGSEFNVDPGSPGVRTDKWRDELSPDDVRTVEEIAGAELIACGYQLAGSRSPEPAAPRPAPRPPPRAGGVRAIAARLRRRRPGVDRAFARHARSQLQANYRTFEDLQILLAEGDDDAALAAFAPDTNFRVVDGDDRVEGRGEDAARELLRAYGDHRERGMRPITGEIHPSPVEFASVGTHELDDGSRWVQTLVVNFDDRRVIQLALYRFRLYM